MTIREEGMRGLVLLAMAFPALCSASGYYKCTDANGVESFSIERCAKGEHSTHIPDTSTAKSQKLDSTSGAVTTQVMASGKHFRGTGSINGVTYRMMVDTGATLVALSAAEAQRAGVDLRNRPVGRSVTANGLVEGVHAILQEVSFAGHTVRNVPAFVQTSGRPSPEILLGMSFLDHFEMNVNKGVLSLHRK